jgi:AcrR family transcriptional regulator
MRMEGKRAAATEATRKAIVVAARALLVSRRWQEFTVEAVAKQAGVTRVTVYNQVGSKRGLLDAVLTELTERARMDQVLSDTDHLSATDACAAIVLQTCRFWRTERDILRPVFGLAVVEPDIAAVLGQREQWRRDQLERLLERLAAEAAPASAFAPGEVLATALAVTSFPTYDRLGPLAEDPERAARIVNHLVRSLVGI